jgi:hypothetical protein
MSAYVVNDECINTIVTYLADGRRQWEQEHIQKALREQGTIGDTFQEKLGNAMFELNCNAVEQRYGDNQAQEFRTLDYSYKPFIHYSGYSVYDRFREWLYQCSEGDIPESSRLYKAIRDVYDQMAHSFFRDLRDRKEGEETAMRRELRQRIEQLEQQFAKGRK